MTSVTPETASDNAESRARADARARLLAPMHAVAEESRRLLHHAREGGADDTVLTDLTRLERRARDLLRAVDGLLHGAVSGEASERGEMLRSKLRHDLRNHLNVIQGYARLLLDTADDAPAPVPAGLETVLSLVGDGKARLEAVLDLGLYGQAPAEHARADVARLDDAMTGLPATGGRRPLPRGRVLVVDDDSATRDILHRLLADDGHTVLPAGGAADALAALARTPAPDLVLLDLVLPDGSGLDVLAAAEGVPVIVISGQDDHTSLEGAVRAGAENVIPKPFDGRLVRLMAGAALRRVAAEAETHRLQAEARGLRDALAADKAELERLSFVLAHDLQEPARGLITHTQRLTRNLAAHMGPEEWASADHATRGARRLRALVEGMHAYLRVDQDLRPPAPVRLDDAVDEALMALPETARRVWRRDPLPEVHGDRRALTRAVRILLDNAHKFARPEQPLAVAVRGWRSGRRVHLLVADNGIGMSPDEAAPVFDLFRTVHGPGAYPGCGAGLAVARRIAAAHGGTIGVRSRPGRGSVFHLTLPAVQEAPGPMADDG